MHQLYKVFLHLSGKEILVWKYQKYFSLKHPKIRFRNRRLLHQISQQTRNMHIFFFGIIFENGFKHIFGICKFFLALVPAMSHSDFDQFRFQFLIITMLHIKQHQRCQKILFPETFYRLCIHTAC